MVGFLSLCFFLSGATALVYEVVSLRMLGLVFGHTVHAVATVLIVFMGGLALGSAVFGGLTRRIRSPIRCPNPNHFHRSLRHPAPPCAGPM